jgi:hypothetical protein
MYIVCTWSIYNNMELVDVFDMSMECSSSEKKNHFLVKNMPTKSKVLCAHMFQKLQHASLNN